MGTTMNNRNPRMNGRVKITPAVLSLFKCAFNFMAAPFYYFDSAPFPML